MTDAQYMHHIRKELGLTQAQMADKLGYNSQTAISMIECGKRDLSGISRKFLEYIEDNEL